MAGGLYFIQFVSNKTKGVVVMESATEYRKINVEEVGDVTVVTFKDEKIIEDNDIDQIGKELFRLIEEMGVDKILVSFSGVDFLSSAALGKLMTLDKKAKARGVVLKLSNIRPKVYEVLAITKLNRLFDIKDDVAGALADF